MAKSPSPKQPGKPNVPPESLSEPDAWAEMCNVEDLTSEQLARIRAENAHLEEGYEPTSSLFPGTGV